MKLETSVVHQKQVKQKILQASQEEALFVSTSSALQSKMEKVEQQLSTSMNGYHIGHHLKNGNIQNQPKCPMNNEKEPVKDDEIASAYFQAKYGNENENYQASNQQQQQHHR